MLAGMEGGDKQYKESMDDPVWQVDGGRGG